MGDMLGISLFHLLNETYLLPQIMYLFSSTSRTNCLLEGSFQQLLERNFTNRYKGNIPAYLCVEVKQNGTDVLL